MTALHCFETLGAFFPVTQNHIPEDRMILLIFIYCCKIIHTTYIIFFAAFREMEASRLKLLGGFGKLWKATISVVISVCPPARLELSSSHWMDFREIVISVGPWKNCVLKKMQATVINVSAQPHAYWQRASAVWLLGSADCTNIQGEPASCFVFERSQIRVFVPRFPILAETFVIFRLFKV